MAFVELYCWRHRKGLDPLWWQKKSKMNLLPIPLKLCGLGKNLLLFFMDSWIDVHNRQTNNNSSNWLNLSGVYTQSDKLCFFLCTRLYHFLKIKLTIMRWIIVAWVNNMLLGVDIMQHLYLWICTVVYLFMLFFDAQDFLGVESTLVTLFPAIFVLKL